MFNVDGWGRGPSRRFLGSFRLIFTAATALVGFGATSPALAADEALWPERRGYVDVPMGQMHYRSQGQGPVVLLLHQTPWYSIQWTKVQPRIAAAGYRAVAPDTPGFGFSPPPKGQPTLEEYADQLVALLDAIGTRDAAVIGHHTGAGIGLVFAYRHPERVRCLVLNGVPLYTDEERTAKLKNVSSRKTELKEDGSHLSEHFRWVRQNIMEGRGSLEGVQLSTLGAQLAEDKERKAYRALFAYPSMQTALRELRMPVLLLTDAEDSLKPTTQWARRIRPDFQYVELQSGGSHIAIDNPDPWSETVISFLDAQCVRSR